MDHPPVLGQLLEIGQDESDMGEQLHTLRQSIYFGEAGYDALLKLGATAYLLGELLAKLPPLAGQIDIGRPPFFLQLMDQSGDIGHKAAERRQLAKIPVQLEIHREKKSRRSGLLGPWHSDHSRWSPAGKANMVASLARWGTPAAEKLAKIIPLYMGSYRARARGQTLIKV